jgi:hypothetical protein
MLSWRIIEREGTTMINRTIEWVRSARSWILNPTCLIDRLLEQMDKLNAVLVVPSQGAGRREARIAAHLDQNFGA